jgi:hypothetical protein
MKQEGYEDLINDEDIEDIDPFEMFDGLQYLLLNCIEIKGEVGASLQDILDCCDREEPEDVGKEITILFENKNLLWKNGRYFIGIV